MKVLHKKTRGSCCFFFSFFSFHPLKATTFKKNNVIGSIIYILRGREISSATSAVCITSTGHRQSCKNTQSLLQQPNQTAICRNPHCYWLSTDQTKNKLLWYISLQGELTHCVVPSVLYHIPVVLFSSALVTNIHLGVLGEDLCFSRMFAPGSPWNRGHDTTQIWDKFRQGDHSE